MKYINNKLKWNLQTKNYYAMFVIVVCMILCCMGCSGMSEKIVGKKITEDNFRDFYYTYSTTVNPPEFQRYRFYMEDNKAYFYHEKREGNNVFLTEDDITASGTKELSSEEWTAFWNLINGGCVKNRSENVDSGNSGPWLYLYWNGDQDVCQEFTFRDSEIVYEFEVFCEGLVASMQE